MQIFQMQKLLLQKKGGYRPFYAVFFMLFFLLTINLLIEDFARIELYKELESDETTVSSYHFRLKNQNSNLTRLENTLLFLDPSIENVDHYGEMEQRSLYINHTNANNSLAPGYFLTEPDYLSEDEEHQWHILVLDKNILKNEFHQEIELDLPPNLFDFNQNSVLIDNYTAHNLNIKNNDNLSFSYDYTFDFQYKRNTTFVHNGTVYNSSYTSSNSKVIYMNSSIPITGIFNFSSNIDYNVFFSLTSFNINSILSNPNQHLIIVPSTFKARINTQFQEIESTLIGSIVSNFSYYTNDSYQLLTYNLTKHSDLLTEDFFEIYFNFKHLIKENNFFQIKKTLEKIENKIEEVIYPNSENGYDHIILSKYSAFPNLTRLYEKIAVLSIFISLLSLPIILFLFFLIHFFSKQFIQENLEEFSLLEIKGFKKTEILANLILNRFVLGEIVGIFCLLILNFTYSLIFQKIFKNIYINANLSIPNGFSATAQLLRIEYIGLISIFSLFSSIIFILINYVKFTKEFLANRIKKYNPSSEQMKTISKIKIINLLVFIIIVSVLASSLFFISMEKVEEIFFEGELTRILYYGWRIICFGIIYIIIYFLILIIKKVLIYTNKRKRTLFLILQSNFVKSYSKIFFATFVMITFLGCLYVNNISVISQYTNLKENENVLAGNSFHTYSFEFEKGHNTLIQENFTGIMETELREFGNQTIDYGISYLNCSIEKNLNPKLIYNFDFNFDEIELMGINTSAEIFNTPLINPAILNSHDILELFSKNGVIIPKVMDTPELSVGDTIIINIATYNDTIQQRELEVIGSYEYSPIFCRLSSKLLFMTQKNMNQALVKEIITIRQKVNQNDENILFEEALFQNFQKEIETDMQELPELRMLEKFNSLLFESIDKEYVIFLYQINQLFLELGMFVFTFPIISVFQNKSKLFFKTMQLKGVPFNKIFQLNLSTSFSMIFFILMISYILGFILGILEYFLLLTELYMLDVGKYLFSFTISWKEIMWFFGLYTIYFLISWNAMFFTKMNKH